MAQNDWTIMPRSERAPTPWHASHWRGRAPSRRRSQRWAIDVLPGKEPSMAAQQTDATRPSNEAGRVTRRSFLFKVVGVGGASFALMLAQACRGGGPAPSYGGGPAPASNAPTQAPAAAPATQAPAAVAK